MRSFWQLLVVAVTAAASALLLEPILPEMWALHSGLAMVLAAGIALGTAALVRRLSGGAPSSEVSVLTSASHEIRTPLNGILGLTQLLLKMRPTAQQREHLEAIKTSGESLHRIINDVLDYAKMRTGKLSFECEPFKLRRRIRQTIQALAPQAHLKKVELVSWVAPDVPDVVTGDPDRLNQVLANLLVNAIKFTDEGEVYLEVTRKPTTGSGDEVVLGFAVSDTGIGIPESRRRDIFDAFSQAEHDGGGRGGLGLGLAISTELIERMGGRIELESEPGRGSTFRFQARFGLEPSEAADGELLPEAPVEDFRILVVDDSPAQRRVLERQIERWGFGVETAATREAAFRCCAQTAFSLVLLDSSMPGVELWSFARELRARAGAPGILMTFAQEHVDTDALRAEGFLGYLQKPIAPTHLLRAIEIIRRGVAIETPEVVRTRDMDRLVLAGHRVLLAEDNPINRTVAVSMLERAGCEVVAVDNGRDALEKLETEAFSIGLVDVEMPEVDGLAVARTVRKREKGTKAHLPLIAITAHARSEDQDRCLGAGMDFFLSKPYEEEELFSLMRRALGGEPRLIPAKFDHTKALERANGDEALLAELSQLFLDEVPQTIEAMRAALVAADMTRLERLAHRLKGSLLTLSARPAGEAALALELACRTEPVEACRALLDALERELERIEPDLLAVASEVKAN